MNALFMSLEITIRVKKGGEYETIAHTLPYTFMTTPTKKDRDNSPVFFFAIQVRASETW
jgi:hypothetical protein